MAVALMMAAVTYVNAPMAGQVKHAILNNVRIIAMKEEHACKGPAFAMQLSMAYLVSTAAVKMIAMVMDSVLRVNANALQVGPV